MSQIMMATVRHVTAGQGLRQFQAARFLLDRVYIANFQEYNPNVKCGPTLTVSK